jgi:hypothetical protein
MVSGLVSRPSPPLAHGASAATRYGGNGNGNGDSNWTMDVNCIQSAERGAKCQTLKSLRRVRLVTEVAQAPCVLYRRLRLFHGDPRAA